MQLLEVHCVADVAYNLIEKMATNGYQWRSERNKPVQTSDIYEVDALTTLAALVEAINRCLDTIQVLPQALLMSSEEWGM